MAQFSSPAIANAMMDIAGHPLTQMKLQKLTFIAHGWVLAVCDAALVDDQAQAWETGPVYPLMCRQYVDNGCDDRGRILDDAGRRHRADLSRSQASVLNRVWARYGGCSADTLSRMTHARGAPWTQSYRDSGPMASIPDDAIARHYRELAARQALPPAAKTTGGVPPLLVTTRGRRSTRTPRES
jgi:uncharacterized phage-associated protein